MAFFQVLQLNYDYDFFVEASEHCDIDYVRGKKVNFQP